MPKSHHSSTLVPDAPASSGPDGASESLGSITNVPASRVGPTTRNLNKSSWGPLACPGCAAGGLRYLFAGLCCSCFQTSRGLPVSSRVFDNIWDARPFDWASR